jgi:hypothetical protein
VLSQNLAPGKEVGQTWHLDLALGHNSESSKARESVSVCPFEEEEERCAHPGPCERWQRDGGER